jgi:hypothetical protein
VNVPGVTTAAFLGGLSGFFDRLCTIKENTGTTFSATGKPIASWTDLAGHVALACRVAPITALSRNGRVPMPEMSVTTASHVVILAGAYPAIKPGMQAVIEGVTYLVQNVIPDSEQLACELLVERVTT